MSAGGALAAARLAAAVPAAAAAAGGAAAALPALDLARRLSPVPRRRLPDRAEQRADRDRIAVLGRDVGQHAGGRRRHLERDLVGLELDQRLVDRTASPGLLEPLPMVASVTDSPSVGTRISAMAISLAASCAGDADDSGG